MVDLALNDEKRRRNDDGDEIVVTVVIDEPMWFKREQKNRRLNRGHVLDVKLRSDQVPRHAHCGWFSWLLCVPVTLFGLYLLWRTGEWALDKFVYENADFAIQRSMCRPTARFCRTNCAAGRA